MINSKDLDERLKQLGWKVFHVAKRVSEIRESRGNVTSATRLNSAIAKAIENPAKSGLETLQDIVAALGGEINIVWEPEKVCTFSPNDELMEALCKRANATGVTAGELVEELLQQALQISSVSEKHKFKTQKQKLDSSITGKGEIQPLQFGSCIASAYTAVHEWLASRAEATGYKELDYSKDIERSLDQEDLQSAAFQFYALFPKNYFKTAYTLKNVIGTLKVLSWLEHNPRICILDIGCAGGAASAAFIETILELQEYFSQPVEIYCLGVDPSIYGITLYSKLMQYLKNNLQSSQINLEFQVLCEAFPKAVIPIIKHLQKKCEHWDKQPCLSHVLLMQLDIISPYSQVHKTKNEQYEKLKELGLDPEILVEDSETFGQSEALAYKQILEEVPIDHLHLITIGTENIEKRIQEISNLEKLTKQLQEIMKVSAQVFRGTHNISEDSQVEEQQRLNHKDSKDTQANRQKVGKHIVSDDSQVEESVCVEYPIGSYLKDQLPEELKIYGNFYTVTNANLQRDHIWNDVINLSHLQLAWVQARRQLLTVESLYDEVEIRLFEENLNTNLKSLRDKLINYHQDVVPSREEIYYGSIKNTSSTRPKVLSRLEEEILQAVLVQVLGKQGPFKPENNSYAYHIGKNSDDTEYLYESWFTAYRKFIQAARQSAIKHKEDGVVIRADIKSYYTHIIQEQLLEITDQQLNIRSERIRWLLRKLLKKEMSKHEIGKGLTQGLLASGFYANLYLSAVDERFNSDNTWNVKFYRYVDDIILVVPNSEDKDKVVAVLEGELNKLGLKLNQNKTEIYDDVAEFLEEIKEDRRLEQLSNDFERIINPLWIMNLEYRSKFDAAYRNNDFWWSVIKRYQQCLRSINIYIAETDLSRRVYKYLFSLWRRDKDLKMDAELKLPIFPNNESFEAIQNWEISFKNSEVEWLEEKKRLRVELINLFQESRRELQEITPISYSRERELQRHIRFVVNRLALLGFEEVWEEIVEILCNEPSLIREPLHPVVNLARQGYTIAIRRLIEHYRNRDSSETSQYMRSVTLQAMRFLPDFNARDWEFLVESATEVDSIVEKLKATETWLFLGEVSKGFVKEHGINAVEKVEKALKSDPPPINRLRKNYILILKMHKPEAIPDLSESDSDYLLRDALDINWEESILNLSETPEPKEIRQYYSGQRPANIHEEVPS